jgi:hypothetical protein
MSFVRSLLTTAEVFGNSIQAEVRVPCRRDWRACAVFVSGIWNTTEARASGDFRVHGLGFFISRSRRFPSCCQCMNESTPGTRFSVVASLRHRPHNKPWLNTATLEWIKTNEAKSHGRANFDFGIVRPGVAYLQVIPPNSPDFALRVDADPSQEKKQMR